MRKIIKLFILIVISFSVYFIYQETKDKSITVLNIGDGLALGINSFGIKEYSYINYYRDYLNQTKKATIINEYSKRDLSINKLLDTIKTNPKLRRDLMEAHQLILVVGYNDLKYQMSLENTLTTSKLINIISSINNDYQNLIEEIRKYYKNEIIVLGYYDSNEEDYYFNKGLESLNDILSASKEVTFISTENLLTDYKKYFSNPHSYYPNRYGYEAIANKIILKTLEKSENI